jgi:hypothetical protein
MELNNGDLYRLARKLPQDNIAAPNNKRPGLLGPFVVLFNKNEKRPGLYSRSLSVLTYKPYGFNYFYVFTRRFYRNVDKLSSISRNSQALKTSCLLVSLPCARILFICLVIICSCQYLYDCPINCILLIVSYFFKLLFVNHNLSRI